MKRVVLGLVLVGCRAQPSPLAPTSTLDVAAAPPVTDTQADARPDTPPREPVSIVPSDQQRCEPGVAPLERRAGNRLLIHAPPDHSSEPNFGRLRTHTEGALSIGMERVWVGPHVPGFVPPAIDDAELFLLERDGEDYVALYREPYGDNACDSQADEICRFVVKGFRDCAPIYTIELRELMSRPTYLEVQDMRVDGGILYFNEACQSYAKEAGGKCSSLVAVDTTTGKLVWRSKPLVSNNRFLVLDRYIISGYGFTDEPDALFVLRRSDGTVVQKVALPKSHENLVIEGQRLRVKMYAGERVFEMRGFDGDAPKLVRLADAK